MNRYKLIIMILLPLTVGLSAQDSVQPPAEPGIELPPVLLEIEDRIVENVETALPDADLPDASDIDATLPVAAAPDPGLSEPAPEGDELVQQEGEDEQGHYFDFIGGLGTLASVSADFTWYYADGEGLTTELNLNHYSSHFWNYQPADRNAMGRREEVGFKLTLDRGADDLELEAGFDEEQLWLQNVDPGINSSTWRTFALQNRYHRELKEGFVLKTRLGLDSALQTDHYGDPGLFADVIFTPGIGFMIERKGVTYELDADYRMGYSQSADHSVELFGQFELELPHKLALGGGFGLAWGSDDLANAYKGDYFGLYFPFFASLSGKPVDYFKFSVKGGFKSWHEDYSGLRDELKWVSWSNLTENRGWFLEAQTLWPVKKIAEFSAGMEFRDTANGVTIGTAPWSAGLISTQQNAFQELYLYAGVKVDPNEWVSLELKWRGQLIEHLTFGLPSADHRLEFGMNYQIPKKWFGGGIDLKYEVYEVSRIPELGMEFFFEIEEGYRLIIEGTDLLSPIYGVEGRPARGPARALFIDEGIQVAIKAEVSL